MRQGRLNRSLGRRLLGLAVVAGMTASSVQPLFARQSTEPQTITSFSGAFLAARIDKAKDVLLSDHG